MLRALSCSLSAFSRQPRVVRRIEKVHGKTHGADRSGTLGFGASAGTAMSPAPNESVGASPCGTVSQGASAHKRSSMMRSGLCWPQFLSDFCI